MAAHTSLLTDFDYHHSFDHDQGGFGVVRDSQIQQDGNPVAKMDVVCVALGSIIDSSTCAEAAPAASLKLVTRTAPLQLRAKSVPAATIEHAVAETGTVTLRADDSCCHSLYGAPAATHGTRFENVARIIANLPKRGAAVYADTYVQPLPVRMVTSIKMSGVHANTNLRGRLATEADVGLVDRLYQDVDLWLERKQGAAEAMEMYPAASATPAAAAMGLFGAPAGQQYSGGLYGTTAASGGGLGAAPTQSMFPTAGGGGSWPGAATAAAPFRENARRLVTFQGRAKLDLALALLARQLAASGTLDRHCDADKVNCGPTTYLNLDMPNTDLGQAAYQRRDAAIAAQFPGTYLRVSAVPATWEPLEARRIGQDNTTHAVNAALGRAAAEPAALFGVPPPLPKRNPGMQIPQAAPRAAQAAGGGLSSSPFRR